MQAKVEQMTAPPSASIGSVPNMLKRLVWDPVTQSDAQPVNATEDALAQLIDDKLCVRSVACIPKFLQVFQHAKTEADEALVLVILRATATGADTKLASACTAAFEKCNGLKITKRWLDEAVDWNYSDLLVLLLDVLKVLPVQLTSITEARINEPIVRLRKDAQEDKVRRAAQDLLKHWRSRFTEKEKEKEKAKAPTGSNNNGSPKAATKTETSSSASTVSLASAVPKSAAEAALKDAKPLKKRPIKRLERLPFGGSSSGSSTAAASSKSSELIGNLMQRKSAKDAMAAKSKKDASSSSSCDNKESSNTSSSDSSSKQISTEKSKPVVMQLPAIQSFKAVTTTAVSKRIRWADEEGKELTKVKLIESWRDMIHYQPQHDEGSFKDAKLREHEVERQMMKSHKEREAFHVVLAHEWTTPPLVKMPQALAARRAPLKTEEVETQSTRTRREMEFMVLEGEVPPLSPKEWARTNEPHRGAPKEIPLLDVDSAAAASAAATSSSYIVPGETEEEHALREALGPLERSTIALLMENERVLPMVYEEAQRNGNRIPDSRVVEIIDYHRRQMQPPQYHQAPPPQTQRYNAAPPPSQAYDSGYSKYGGGGGGYNSGPPPVAGGPPGYDYSRQQYAPPPQSMHHQSLKRKAPGGGIFSDAPPAAKRMAKRGAGGAPLQCMYFLAPSGCKHGNNCQYAHDGPPPQMGGGGPDYGSAYGPPQGGRFGHQPPMGMRGGMRGGR